jgi:hypothetical protein
MVRRRRQSGLRAGGSQGPVVNSWRSASSLSSPHLSAVERYECTTARSVSPPRCASTHPRRGAAATRPRERRRPDHQVRPARPPWRRRPRRAHGPPCGQRSPPAPPTRATATAAGSPTSRAAACARAARARTPPIRISPRANARRPSMASEGACRWAPAPRTATVSARRSRRPRRPAPAGRPRSASMRLAGGPYPALSHRPTIPCAGGAPAGDCGAADHTRNYSIRPMPWSWIKVRNPLLSARWPLRVDRAAPAGHVQSPLSADSIGPDGIVMGAARSRVLGAGSVRTPQPQPRPLPKPNQAPEVRSDSLHDPNLRMPTVGRSWPCYTISVASDLAVLAWQTGYWAADQRRRWW